MEPSNRAKCEIIEEIVVSVKIPKGLIGKTAQRIPEQLISKALRAKPKRSIMDNKLEDPGMEKTPDWLNKHVENKKDPGFISLPNLKSNRSLEGSGEE